MNEPALLYTPSRPFRRVSLEMSLKPFYDATPRTRRQVAEQLFRQWMPICHRADSVSIMLWAADGSEILDYRGELDASFEWAKWLGSANHWQLTTPKEVEPDSDEQGLGFHSRDIDPERQGLHLRSYPYRENPAQFTYRWLKDLIADFKEVGAALTGKRIEVGLTFDPGPEFSVSDFKYRRHPEICNAGVLFGNSFVPCTARLNADDVSYAGFPNGIPQDIGIGTFLGRQLQCLQRDIGFDFVWFSNGFGFGNETWSLRGALFDGEKFYPEKAAQQREAILEFWNDFRRECPQIPVRTRGTNLTTGVDITSDGVPLQEIYRTIHGVEAPVNSPWAALDGDFGLELTGWMSHVAELPNDNFNYRFYAHDPWWMNSPWFDRYERRAHDIFLPGCVARLDESGSVQPPDNLSILSVDNSHGQLPDTFAAEISANLLRTRELAPDAIAPLLWIYPFTEYHTCVFEEGEPQTPYFGDWFVRGMINNGLPLNTVSSTENFLRLFEDKPQHFRETILVTPVPRASTPLHNALLKHVQSGGRVLLYGPIPESDTELLSLLGLEVTSGFEGDLSLELDECTREFFAKQPTPELIHHPAIFSAGPLCHVYHGAKDARQIANVKGDGEERSLAVISTNNEWNGGALCWLRGSISADEERSVRLLPAPLDKEKYFSTEALARAVLAQLGFSIELKQKQPEHRVPMLTLARSRNAWVFAAYNPDDVALSFRLPYGAPVPLGNRVRVENSTTHFTPPTAWLAECRVFVDQEEQSTLYVQEVPSIMAGVRRRWLVKGLEDSTLRFFPQDENKVEFLVDPVFPYFTGDFREAKKVQSASGEYLEVEIVGGNLLISW